AHDGDRRYPGSPLSLFFFSSRRRHTRSDRDWSSDVCSSDLARPSSWASPTSSAALAGAAGTSASPPPSAAIGGAASRPRSSRTRSEERRVGKEGSGRCRARHQNQEQETEVDESTGGISEHNH